MQRTDKIRIAEVLSKISKRLIQDEFFLQKLEVFLQKEESRKNEDFFNDILDVFAIYTDEGEEGLKHKLELLDVSQLVNIIKKSNLDPSKLSHKWKKKDKLVSLIVTRISGRMEKGKTFLDYNQ